MELREFIKETFNQILDGVIASQEYANTKGAEINPKGLVYPSGSSTPFISSMQASHGHRSVQLIDFDIAVTTSEGSEAKGVVGIFVGPLTVGIQGRIEDGNSQINRIKFSIPICFPYPPA